MKTFNQLTAVLWLAFISLAAQAQVGLINDDFAGSSHATYITPTTGAAIAKVSGKYRITMVQQSTGKYRGDFSRVGGATVHAGNYPIVAIKFTKHRSANLTFDTNLGAHSGGISPKYSKYATPTGNVYYWDLQTGKLGTVTLDSTTSTSLSVFQFKVSDLTLTSQQVTNGENVYEVEWVKSFATFAAFKAFIDPTAPAPYAYSGSFSHPGLLHNATDLLRIKNQVTNQFGRPYRSYEVLEDSPYASATYVMKGPYQKLTRDAAQTILTPAGSVSGNVAKAGIESDALAAYYNAMRWNITGNTAHATKAIQILNAYAGYTTDIVGADTELNGLYGFLFANAAEIMNNTACGWAAADVLQCKNMLKSVFYTRLRNFAPSYHGNWDIICMKALMSIAIFSDDVPMFNRVVNYFYTGQGNGSINNYVVSAAGQLQESNRDQAHCFLGIGAMTDIAEMAYKQGLDLYAASGNAIMRGLEYVAKYNLGKTVPYQTSYDFYEINWTDYTPTMISDKERGLFRPIFEAGYNHYVFRKGLSMPETLEALATHLNPETQPVRADNTGYGSLLFYLNTDAEYEYNGVPILPETGLIDDNFTAVTDGWVPATTGSTFTTQANSLKVNTATQANGTRRGDVRKNGGVKLYPANYPILAIKYQKPNPSNLTVDSNLGSLGNGLNKWTGTVGSDIYYYDLKTLGFGEANVKINYPTALNLFQFKIADLNASVTSYDIDWIKTFKSLDELNDLVALSAPENARLSGTRPVSSVSIYPNPVSEEIQIKHGDGETIAGVSIFDKTGAAVAMKSGIDRYKNSDRFYVGNLPSGLYVVKVSFASGRTDTFRIVKK